MEQLRTKNIILLSLFISSIVNFINCIIYKYSWINYIIYPGILFLIFVFYLVFKDYKVNSILFFVCSILSIIFGNCGNLTGAIFLCFAFYIIKKKKIINIVICMIILTILIKFIIEKYTLAQMMNYIIIFIAIILIYFDLIHPKKIINTCVIKIDEIDSQIIEFLIKGLKNKEISDKVYLSSNAVTKRIEKLRKKYNCYNNEQLIYQLFEKRFFRLK